MGLTYQSCGSGVNKQVPQKGTSSQPIYTVALAGNPNTGKSTLFNALTGMNQHTGNWPGKTVHRAEGKFINQGAVFKLIDLPGTYSLLAHSPEEQVARDYLCFGKPDATVVVVDATCLERNLNLVLQVLEITPRVVVCVNLVDEARRKNLHIDLPALTEALGVPAVATVARDKIGIGELTGAVQDVASGRITCNPLTVKYNERIEAAIAAVEPELRALVGTAFNTRWLAMRLLDKDPSVIAHLEEWLDNSRHSALSLRAGGIFA